MWTSVPQIDARRTRISASFGPGSGIRIEPCFEAFHFALHHRQSRSSGGHDAAVEGFHETKCAFERIGRVEPSLPFDHQRTPDPLAQFAPCQDGSVSGDVEVAQLGMSREQFRQRLLRMVEVDAVLTLLEQGLQAAENQRRSTGSP